MRERKRARADQTVWHCDVQKFRVVLCGVGDVVGDLAAILMDCERRTFRRRAACIGSPVCGLCQRCV